MNDSIDMLTTEGFTIASDPLLQTKQGKEPLSQRAVEDVKLKILMVRFDE